MATSEETRNKNLREANELLSESIDLAGTLSDKMNFFYKQSKEKYFQDKQSVDLTKKLVDFTKVLASQYESVKDVEKDIAKSKKIQNEIARQQLSLERTIGQEGKNRIKQIKDQKQLEKDLTKQLEKAREEENAGVRGARQRANSLAQQVINARSLNQQYQENLSSEERQYMMLEQTGEVIERNNAYLNEQLRIRKNIENAEKGLVTLTGNLGKAFDKIGLSGIGKVFTDSAEKSKKLIYEATDGGKKTIGTFTKMKIAANSFGAALKVALGPMAILGLIVSLFNKAKEVAKESGEYVKKLDQQTADFGRSLGISGRKAAALTNEARSMGAAMGITTEMATQSSEAIYTSLEGAEKVSSKTLTTFMKLNVFAGMSADNLASIYKLSKLTGQPAEKTAEAMASTARESIKANKVNISMKQVMDGVSKVSATMKLNFGGSAEGLTRAFIQSKKLGLELSKVDEIASNLLNIEDSIAAEMEAELMTGKELNLEKAREAALNNDNATLMSEIANQFGSIEDFQKMNRVQQESFAKSIGMSRDGLADMLVSSKENEAKNTDLVDTQQQSLAAMQSQASTAEKMAVQDEARLAAAGNLGKEQLKLEENMKKLELLGTQIVNTFAAPMLEKVVAIVDKVVELIDRFKAARAEGNGIFDSITKVWQATDTFGKVLMGVVGTLTAIKGIMFLINTYQNIRLGVQKLINIEMIKEGAQMIKNGARAALDFAKSVGTAIMKAISSLSSIPVIGFGLGIAAGATIAGLAAKYMNDGVISPSQGKGGYGNRVMYGPEGAISFNNKDTIVAGTNLFGDDVVSGPKESVSMGGGALLQEMKEIKAIMSQILHKEGNVTLDGSKVGKALTLSGYRM
jgi:hypothetical protein